MAELLAIARQGWLMARAIGRPESRLEGERAAVFVHGWLAGGGVFDPMRRAVETALGVPTTDFQYAPYGTFESVEDRFERFVRGVLAKVDRVALVGHSLGGLVARSFVQTRADGGRVDTLVTLATPHGGIERAGLAPIALLRAAHPKSAVMRRLGRSLGSGGPKHVVIVAGDDRTVSPTESATRVEGAEIVWVDAVGHNESLFDPRVHQAVIDALRPSSSGPTSAR